MFVDPGTIPILTTPDANGRYTRRVERAVVHEAPLSFEALYRIAVPRDAGVIVLDLDKTCFLGLNMGEMLGWELTAQKIYGGAHLDHLEAQRARKASRLLVDPSSPLGFARYFGHALGIWAWPGLSYLFGYTLPARFDATHRWLYRQHGTEPVQSIQSIPQMNLLHQLSQLPVARAKALATRLLHRFSGAQVITPQDLDGLRAWCPDATIVLSSGSPVCVAEAAAEHLGISLALGTEIEMVEGVLSAPPFFRPLSAHARQPHRIAPLRSISINTGPRKIARLRALLPEAFDAPRRAPWVGITDTDHGEDHCWAEHLDHVIDLNSRAPFSPIVGATSPLRTLHSARVPSRDGTVIAASPPPDASNHPDPLLERVEALTRSLARHLREEKHTSPASPPLLHAISEAEQRIEAAISNYNSADPETPARARHLRALKATLDQRQRLGRRYARATRETSALLFEILRLRAQARGVVPTP